MGLTLIALLIFVALLLFLVCNSTHSLEGMQPVYPDWDREDQPPPEIPGVDAELQAELDSPLYSSEELDD